MRNLIRYWGWSDIKDFSRIIKTVFYKEGCGRPNLWSSQKESSEEHDKSLDQEELCQMTFWKVMKDQNCDVGFHVFWLQIPASICQVHERRYTKQCLVNMWDLAKAVSMLEKVGNSPRETKGGEERERKSVYIRRPVDVTANPNFLLPKTWRPEVRERHW